MDPGQEILKDGWLKFFDLALSGGSGSVFGWKFGMDPGVEEHRGLGGKIISRLDNETFEGLIYS